MNKKTAARLLFLFISTLIMGVAFFPNYWLLFISLLFYVVSLVIVFRLSGFPRILSPTSLFFIFYTIFIYAGSVILAATEGEYILLYISTSSVFAFSLGVLCVSKVKGFHAVPEFKSYLSKPVIDDWHNVWFWNSFIALLCITLIMVAFYFKKYGIPLLSENIQLSRTEATHGSDYYIHFIRTILPFVALILLARVHYYGLFGTKVLAYLFCCVTGLCLIATGYRGPILHFFIMVIFLSQFFKGFPWRKVIVYGGVGFTILSVLTILRRFKGSVEDFEFVFFKLLVPRLYHRIILTNPLNIIKISDFIPSVQSYMLGKSYIMDIATLAPGPQVGFAGYMTEQAVRVGRTAMTPTLAGELYGNFGLLGLPVGMFLSGCIVHSFFIWFLRQKRTIGRMVFFSCIFLWLSKLVMAGWGRIIVIQLFPIAVTYFLLRISSLLVIKRTHTERTLKC